MATVKDIALKCGVSIGTVDRVLHNRGRVNAETRQKILKAAEELQYVPNRAAQSLAVHKKRLHLAFVVTDPEMHPFFQDINDAAQGKAEELREFGVTVTFLLVRHVIAEDGKYRHIVSYPQGISPDQFDGIVAPGFLSPELKEQVVAHGVPCVSYNLETSNFPVLCHVGSDYRQSGFIAAGLCNLCGGENPRIAAFSEAGDIRKIPSYDQRMEGFHKRLAEAYPSSQFVGEFFFSENRERNAALIRRFLEVNPSITVAYVVNPADYDVCRIIHELDARGQIRIITHDLVPTQKSMFKDGTISATITQEPEKQGALPLDILFRYLAFGERPESDIIYTRLRVMIANNI